MFLKIKFDKIKTKQNPKLRAILFNPFQVLYLIEKQANKLQVPNQQKIYNVFYVFLLEQNNTKKKLVDKVIC